MIITTIIIILIISIMMQVFGLTPGPHGFHVHTSGNMTDHCKVLNSLSSSCDHHDHHHSNRHPHPYDHRHNDNQAAGGHFNPHGKTHGAPTAGVSCLFFSPPILLLSLSSQFNLSVLDFLYCTFTFSPFSLVP